MFAGKVALVTGGAAGLGLCYVHELLKSGIHGVAIVDIDANQGAKVVKSVEKEFGAKKAIFVKTDVTKPDELENAFKQTIQTWNSLDIVINNAGIFREAQWELQIAINTVAVTRSTYLALKYMSKDKGGKGGTILNASSIVGLAPMAFGPVYSATKHFVIGLTRSLGTDHHYKRTGVRILAICPGLAHTAMPADGPSFANTADLGQDVNQLLTEELKDMPGQAPEVVGREMITIMAKGESGSLWVVEEGEVYEVEIPDRRALKKRQ